MEEQAIIFQAVVPIGERRSMMNAWFKIQPTPKISGPFHARQPPFRLGISSAFVGSSLYTIGGRVPNHFLLSDSISWLDTTNAFSVWKTSKLRSRCVDSVLGVYSESLFIFPGVWKYGYYHMDEDKYLTNQKGYIWNTRENECPKTKIGPPKVEGEKLQWRRIRVCAAMDKEGLLIAMDGEKNNFFLYKPEKNDWEICKFKDPLPKFLGETSSAASNGRLYILEVQEKSPALLYIYDIKEGKLVIDKKPILETDNDLWSMDEWDRVVRLVPVADDKLCLLWLGPVSYENENGWPPVRNLHYLKFKVSSAPNSVEVEDEKVFPTNITDLLGCLPCDLEQFEAEAKGESQPLTQNVKRKGIIAPEKNELVIENAILFQAVVPSGERELMMNGWFKIQSTAQVFGPFHGGQPFRLGIRISSTFVGSSLYTIGREVPSSRLPKPCEISWLDTSSPFNGWETGELPSSCVDSVICVDGVSLYILTKLEGYIWNTRDNQCLQTRIHLPRVEGGGQKQRPRIRACAALHGNGLLIAMDGENNTNVYLHPGPENKEEDWKEADWRKFWTPLPAFKNEISFAVLNGRLYILDFSNYLLASLYIDDSNEMKIVPNHKIDWQKLNASWKLDEKDRVVHLVPVADDMLCFLGLGPSANENEWPPVKTLYYLKLKFSFDPDEAFEIVDDRSFRTNITNLLNCLPCGPEQFRAEVDPLDAFQKRLEDDAPAEAIGPSLIHDPVSVGVEPFQDQAGDMEGDRKWTQVGDLISAPIFGTHYRQIKVTRSIGDDDLKPAVTPEPEKMDTVLSAEDECLKKRKVEKKSTFRYELCEHNGREKPFSKCSYGIYYRAAERLREQNEQAEREREENEQGGNEQEHSECVIMDCGKDICHVKSQIKSSRQMGNEYALEVIHIDNTETSEVKVIYPYFENTLSKWLEKLDLPKETDEYDKWMQDEVFPKIRKLWQILLKMKENERNKPYCLPLINGVPKLLYINEEDGEKNKRDTSDDRSSLSNQGQSERELLDYPIKVLSVVVAKLQSSDESYKLPKYIEEAKEIWTFNPSESKLLQGHPFLRIHPVLYKSYEKSRFLQLFYNITLEYKLSSWLDEKMSWSDFENCIMLAGKTVYVKTLYKRSSSQGNEWYKSKKRHLHHSQPSSDAFDEEQSDLESLSSNQGQSNPKIPNYYRGSHIVTFTRNVLTHFNDNDENSQGGRLADDEIAETVDRDLAVCSLYYAHVKHIIADQSLKELMGENWQKAKEKLEEFLKSLE